MRCSCNTILNTYLLIYIYIMHKTFFYQLSLLLLLLSSCASHKQMADNVTYSTDYDGIDVSRHNGVIDWKAVRRYNKHIKYVYVKATEGTGHTDRRYIENAREAHRNGFKVGIYHYFTSRSSAHEQFDWFRSQANLTYQDLAPIVDVEDFKGWQSKQQLQDSLMMFTRLVKKHYNKLPIIYTHQNFYNTYLSPRFNRHYLFIAAYRRTAPVINGAKYDLWQFTDAGRVKGIKGSVDLSRMSDAMSLKKLLLP